MIERIGRKDTQGFTLKRFGPIVNLRDKRLVDSVVHDAEYVRQDLGWPGNAIFIGRGVVASGPTRGA